jgi:hypothetical protein
LTREIPHYKVLARLNRLKVDYVLIGVLAINHYSDTPESIYFTQDCDVLLRPDLPNLRRAVRVVVAEGYSLEAGGEPLPPPDDLTLERILKHRANIVSRKRASLTVDLVLDAGGMSFAKWKTGRRLFKAGTIRVPCASLRKLLLAKKRAGRKKDRAFLALYRAGLRDQTN